MTPSRSRKTARPMVENSIRVVEYGDPGRDSELFSGARDNHGTREVVVSLLPLNVSQTPVPRNHIDHHLAAFVLEAETELAQARAPHRLPQAELVVFAVQHQEASAAGARDLSSNRAMLLGEVIPFIDLAVADSV